MLRKMQFPDVKKNEIPRFVDFLEKIPDSRKNTKNLGDDVPGISERDVRGDICLWNTAQQTVPQEESHLLRYKSGSLAQALAPEQ
jgi:hypothetical protein